MRELVRLRENVKPLNDAGIDVVVVSTDKEATAKARAERLRFPFPVASDVDGKLLEATGLRDAGKGPQGADIFYATLFVVDPSGRVAWKFVSRAVNQRATPEDIIVGAESV